MKGTKCNFLPLTVTKTKWPQSILLSGRSPIHTRSAARSWGPEARGKYYNDLLYNAVSSYPIQMFILKTISTYVWSSNPDMMAAVVNTLGQLVKLRPSLQGIIITALTTWTPAAINHLSATAVRSVEKSVRILLLHLHFSRWAPDVLPCGVFCI